MWWMLCYGPEEVCKKSQKFHGGCWRVKCVIHPIQFIHRGGSLLTVKRNGIDSWEREYCCVSLVASSGSWVDQEVYGFYSESLWGRARSIEFHLVCLGGFTCVASGGGDGQSKWGPKETFLELVMVR